MPRIDDSLDSSSARVVLKSSPPAIDNSGMTDRDRLLEELNLYKMKHRQLKKVDIGQGCHDEGHVCLFLISRLKSSYSRNPIKNFCQNQTQNNVHGQDEKGLRIPAWKTIFKNYSSNAFSLYVEKAIVLYR